MELNDELLQIVREIAALKVSVVQIGDAIDKLDGKQSEDKKHIYGLIREAEHALRDVEVSLAEVRQRCGMDAGETVMGDKVEIHGADIKGSQVGTGGQKKTEGKWVKVATVGLIVLAIVLLAGAFRLEFISDWFSVEPTP